MNQIKLSPFLKWAGGKRWLCQKHSYLFPKKPFRLVEPFTGSAAVFFSILPKIAILADANVQLIDTYRAVRDDWQAVDQLLHHHHHEHSMRPNEYYYEIRTSIPLDKIELAARFIYLNRTCFNGLYRVNRKNVFNVPKGTKNSVVLPDDNFKAVSEALTHTDLINSDFESVINNAGHGDFLFVDPPYTVKHNKNGFIKYNEKLFSWSDQERLAGALSRLRDRGGTALVTNAAHDSVSNLYSAIGSVRRIERRSILASSSINRNIIEELVVTIGYDALPGL